ncbi:hypothetical protein D3C81_1845590 [compost metagenome]
MKAAPSCAGPSTTAASRPAAVSRSKISPDIAVMNATTPPSCSCTHLLWVPGNATTPVAGTAPLASRPSSSVSSPRMMSGAPSARRQASPGTIATACAPICTGCRWAATASSVAGQATYPASLQPMLAPIMPLA